MATNFADLLSKPSGETKRPPNTPAGHYIATAVKFSVGESNKKKTPFVRIHFQFNEPTEDVDQTAFEEFGGLKKLLGKEMGLDMYLRNKDGEETLYVIDEFFEKVLGWPISGRTHRELLAELSVNRPQALVEVVHEPNEQGGDPFVKIRRALPMPTEEERAKAAAEAAAPAKRGRG